MTNKSAQAECTVKVARDLKKVPHPTIPRTFILEERIIVGPAGMNTQAGISADKGITDAFAPTRIGYMSDVPHVTSGLGVFIDPVILALEDAINEGRLKRSVEIIASHVIGLPTGQPQDVIAAYLDLVAKGCVLILSCGVTDNSLVLQETINKTGVPFITMAGTTRFIGPHCFSLANGGHGEETAIMASYLAEQGLKRVVVTGERSPGDSEYHLFFQEQARLYGVDILKEHYFDQRPGEDEIDEALRHFRDDLKPDALVYCGFGWSSFVFNAALERIGWQPPKIMNTAIMWALGGGELAKALDGWIGIEQTIEEDEGLPMNPNYVPMLDRFEARFGYRPRTTMTALCYDEGRVAVEAIVNCPLLTGEGMSLGIERIKMMPSTLGGPRTYIAFGPHDHRGYKGDFLFLKQLRDEKFHFVAYHDPQWKSNRES
jgi:branched-chain amino acid transport system substrate-binding protein